ncbi:ABC transporter permease, partial [Intestinimonas butyriciproducens]|nr:ABC transporter permease [Intestinimonas butyriciproducens]
QKNFQFLPYQMWYPAIVLCVLMISFNLLGDGLRDAFDPKTRR